jgi:hypothetical protein
MSVTRVSNVTQAVLAASLIGQVVEINGEDSTGFNNQVVAIQSGAGSVDPPILELRSGRHIVLDLDVRAIRIEGLL